MCSFGALVLVTVVLLVSSSSQFHSDDNSAFFQASIVANQNAGPRAVDQEPQTVAISGSYKAVVYSLNINGIRCGHLINQMTNEFLPRAPQEAAKTIRNLNVLPIQVDHSGVLGPYVSVVHVVPDALLFEMRTLPCDSPVCDCRFQNDGGLNARR
jgi:hypothetical protein